MAQNLTDDQLVAGCQRGDRAAQHELYARTSERIHRLLLRMTHNADDAFDLAQETYVHAFTRIAQFDQRSTIATWLYRIAVNEALQFLRRKATGRAALARRTAPPTDGNGDGREALRIDVDAALAAASPEDRAMLILRYQEGLDYAAIAEISGIAAGTVASRLNRARQRIRHALQTGYAAEEETRPAAHPTTGCSPRSAEPRAPSSQGPGAALPNEGRSSRGVTSQ